MDFQIDQAVNILSTTPAALNTLLRDAPEEWTMYNNGGESWSPWAVVGHMLHGEENDWIPRARIILDYGESRAFDPFDREAMFNKFEGIPLSDLLDRFAAARAKSMDELKALALTPERLQSPGLHPSLGKVSLSQLLSTWVVHDMNHLGQIVEVMARHYKQAVGPWIDYLPILTRTS
jgi:uncharacterized damage-inducible protein DinB